MPKKHQPRWGYRSRPWFVEEREPFFSDDVLDQLLAKYAIPDALADRVRNQLEMSADIYHAYRNNMDTAPRPAEKRVALEEISNLAARLRECLDEIDDFTGAMFWASEIQTTQAALLTDAETTEFGHQISRHKSSDGSEVIWWENRDVLRRSLDVIGRYADAALDRLPTDQGGPTQLEGLRMWAANMRNLWENILCRRFTVDYEGSDPVSDAAAFCVDALQSVDPDVRSSSVITALRKTVKAARRGSSGKMPSQN
ncbi:hypothetical protein [Rhodospira trueperi]|uniref:Uncharacterized protein n=1 Tax=Rhodospira trueperi TaxID=69960 RepID=A0A1G7ELV4_9PROT|nr:hypothetical protein [Rhodospira trueperi]SDE64713.1 hypothetical protein SAMN05421720_109128 [Rhodospira trueperi]